MDVQPTALKSELAGTIYHFLSLGVPLREHLPGKVLPESHPQIQKEAIPELALLSLGTTD